MQANVPNERRWNAEVHHPTSSIAAFRGQIGQFAYAATKAGNPPGR